MNNRYLFRGKRIDNGEWVEGYLSFIYVNGKNEKGFICADKANIYNQDDVKNYDVALDTVSQCTGLCDKNGKLIFEGDIVRDSFRWVSVVEWDYEDARFLGYMIGRKEPTISYVGREPEQEIIGNKWDNPELLEGIV